MDRHRRNFKRRAPQSLTPRRQLALQMKQHFERDPVTGIRLLTDFFEQFPQVRDELQAYDDQLYWEFMRSLKMRKAALKKSFAEDVIFTQSFRDIAEFLLTEPPT